MKKGQFTTLPKLTTKQYRQIAKPRPTNRGFVLSNLHQPSLTSIFHLHRPTWSFGTPPHSLDYGY